MDVYAKLRRPIGAVLGWGLLGLACRYLGLVSVVFGIRCLIEPYPFRIGWIGSVEAGIAAIGIATVCAWVYIWLKETERC